MAGLGIVMLGFSAPAYAQAPGDFDGSFGTGGSVMTQLGAGANPYSYGFAVDRQPDGRVIVAGEAIDSGGNYELSVARLNPDGSFDPSFGTGGKVVTQLGAGPTPFSSVHALALQPDGKIVLAGTATDSGGHYDLLVVRLNADGSFDSSFGPGGKVVNQLGAGPNPTSVEGGLALQPDGKIVVAGEATDSAGHYELLVARLNADGSFDTSFGTGGKVLTSVAPTTSADAYALALQPDGKIIVVGQGTDSAGNYELLVARLNADGGFDSSFGTAGKVVTQLGASSSPYSNARGVALQPDGRIIIAGDATDSSGYDRFMVARLNADGSFDSSFGTAGKVVTQLGAGTSPSSSVFALAVAPDGKLLVAGDASDSGGHDQVLVARLIGDLPPTASFTVSPDPGHAGQAMVFDAIGSNDPDGTIDAYHWSFGDGVAGTGVTAAHTFASPGSYTVALTVIDDDGLAASSAQTITVTAPGESRFPTASALRLTHVAQSHRRWREGRGRTRIGRIKHVPVGTTFRFTVNKAARMQFTFVQRLPGHRANGRCVARARRNRTSARCTRILTRGVLSLSVATGSHAVRFRGRISKRTRLKPGRYTLIITAHAATGRATAELAFTIVKG